MPLAGVPGGIAAREASDSAKQAPTEAVLGTALDLDIDAMIDQAAVKAASLLSVARILVHLKPG
jgi:hypothetical protein